MSLGPPLNVNATAPIMPPSMKKEILWPTICGYGNNGADSVKFPSMEAIKARLAAQRPAHLAAFVAAAQEARKHILVIDDYLFNPYEDQMREDRIDQILE